MMKHGLLLGGVLAGTAGLFALGWGEIRNIDDLRASRSPAMSRLLGSVFPAATADAEAGIESRPGGPAVPGRNLPPYSDLRSEERLVFAVFGDQGTGDIPQYRVSQAMHRVCGEAGCQFAIVLGDNIYENGVDDVFDGKFRTHFELPYSLFGRFDFWMAAGNHDWRDDVRAQIEYTYFSDRWRMPYYHYEIPALPSWITIYAYDTMRMNRAQIEISKRALCDQEARWKFIFGHHPIYSNGKHGDSDRMRRALMPVIRDCGVDVFFAGHDHHQEHISAQGFEQIIQGAAGKLRDVDQVPYRPGDDRRQNFARSEYGFAVTEVTPDRMNVRFYDSRGNVLYTWGATPDEIGLE